MHPRTCSRCGAVDGTIGAHDLRGDWHTEDQIEGMNSGDGASLFGPEWSWKMTTVDIVRSREGDDLCRHCRYLTLPPARTPRLDYRCPKCLWPVNVPKRGRRNRAITCPACLSTWAVKELHT